MISDKTRNLFLFIEFLHENIENFNQYEIDVSDWHFSIYKINHIDDHYKDQLALSDFIELRDEKWTVISENIYEPIDNKAMELNIYSFEGYDDTVNYQEILNESCCALKNDIIELTKYYDNEDVEEILKIKRKYIEFRCETDFLNIGILFKKMDEIMSPILDIFHDEDDKELPVKKDGLTGNGLSLSEGDYYINESYFESFNHINNDNIDEIDTKTVIDMITVFTEAVYTPIYHKGNFKAVLILDGMKSFYFDVANKIKSAFTYYFMEGDIDVLKRTKLLLQKGLTKWKDVYDKEGYYIDVRFERYDLLKMLYTDNEMKNLAEMKLPYINRLIETIDELLNSTTEKEENEQQTQVLIKTKQVEKPNLLINLKNTLPIETNFSVSQWAAIFYYANTKKLLPKTKNKSDGIKMFMEQHNTNTTFDYLINSYYKTKKKINKECNYPTDKLEEIIPFMEKHYKQTVPIIENDIEHIKDEKREREEHDY